MGFQSERWVQMDNGVWILRAGTPRLIYQKSERPLRQKNLQEPDLAQDRGTNWEGQDKLWNRELVIDQERQQFMLHQLLIVPDDAQEIYPFAAIPLNRNDIKWLIENQKAHYLNKNEEQPCELNLQKSLLNNANLNNLQLTFSNFWKAQLEDVNFTDAQLKEVDFSEANLNGANFAEAQLDDANFTDAQLKSAHFVFAELKEACFAGALLEDAYFINTKLEGAIFSDAKLEGAHFLSAQLEGADFRDAKLEGAHFRDAKLEGVDFRDTKLEGADFRDAKLEGADFRNAQLANAQFEHATLATAQGLGPKVADAIGWDEIHLSIIEWSRIKLLGDEAEAKKRMDSIGKNKSKIRRLEEYRASTRAYRQIATALEGQGLKEEAESFAYRAQIMQRKVRWWNIKQEKRTFWQRLADVRAWLFSWLLALLSGYGYRFGHSFYWYLGILVLFAWFYMQLSQGVPPHSSIPDHLSWLDALILSISDMVGRGFFRQDVTLSDPYAGVSVLEGMIGVFMDVLLISTLTQRLFKK